MELGPPGVCVGSVWTPSAPSRATCTMLSICSCAARIATTCMGAGGWPLCASVVQVSYDVCAAMHLSAELQMGMANLQAQ